MIGKNDGKKRGGKMYGSVTDFDNELRKKVGAMEVDIPGDLEERFLKELDRLVARPGNSTKPGFLPSGRKRGMLPWTLATAASLLLIVFLAVTVFYRSSPAPVSSAQEVLIDDAKVEGQPVNIYIISQRDPDMTIIWLEKAPIISLNRNIDSNIDSNIDVNIDVNINKYKEI